MSAAYQEVQEKAKKLDPVGKEDGDVDNDGDKDSSDKYLMKRRKAISKAMKEHHQKDENGKVIEHDEEEVEEAYTVTNADKKGNTKAYQNFKAGMKGKDGKPLYKAADHMKEEEISPIDSVLSPEELERVAQISKDYDAAMEEGYKGTMDMSKSHPEAVKKMEDHIAKHFGKKRVPGGKKGVKEDFAQEGSAYGLTRGTGKPGGAMKAYLDNKAKKLEAEKKKQRPEYRNNPAFGDPSHHSNAKNK